MKIFRIVKQLVNIFIKGSIDELWVLSRWEYVSKYFYKKDLWLNWEFSLGGSMWVNIFIKRSMAEFGVLSRWKYAVVS